MQGLSTQACKAFSVLDVFKLKEETLKWDRDEYSSLLSTISTLQFSSPLTISLPCVLPHVGEVDEDDNSLIPTRCIAVPSINKSVEPNEEQKVLTSGFNEGFTANTSKQVFRG